MRTRILWLLTFILLGSLGASEAAPPRRTLSVTRQGAGTGTVTSSPTGITCGSDCIEIYANQTNVTLTATPASGSVFGAWIGCTTPTSNTCAMQMNKNHTVSARFDVGTPLPPPPPPGDTVTFVIYGDPAAASYQVEARTTTSGDIRIQFSINGVVYRTEMDAAYALFLCEGVAELDCRSSYGAGSNVILAQVFAQTGSTILASNSITIIEGSPSPPATPSLSVLIVGTGSVMSSPVGIVCPGDCSEGYVSGTLVRLTATPGAGKVLTGWTTPCSGTGLTCDVTVTASNTIQVTFATAPKNVLTWTDNATNESNFQVERGLATAGPFSQIAVLGANAVTHTDPNVVIGTNYCYRVRATNAGGNSTYTSVVCRTP